MMYGISHRLILSLGIVCLCLAFRAGSAADDSRPFAFIGVNVIPMETETVLPGMTVVVKDGRISAMGPVEKTGVPEDAVRIDAEGKYLMPGLAEMHAHVPDAREGEDYAHDVLFLYVANGVTTVRGMLGAPYHLQLRDELARHAVLGPRLVTSGPSLNGNSVASPMEARRMVREQRQAGYDFLKLHPGLDPERYAAIVETAREVGMPFAGHVSEAVGLWRTLEARQASIDHLDAYMHALAERHPQFGQTPGWRPSRPTELRKL